MKILIFIHFYNSDRNEHLPEWKELLQYLFMRVKTGNNVKKGQKSFYRIT